MIIALNENNLLVNAKRIKKKERQAAYYCPSCKSKVILKKGQIRIPHFSHQSTVECQSFSEGETEEHLLGKELLYKYFQENKIKVEMEWYLPELKQRPDLYLPDQKIAVEFQCSPISYEKLKERSTGYQTMGIDVIWIVGKKFHILHRPIRSSEKLFIQDIGVGGPYFLELDVVLKTLSIVLSFDFKANQSRIVCSLEVETKENNMIGIIEQIKSYPRNDVRQVDALKRHLQLHQRRARKATFFHKQLYEKRETILSLPIECYLLVQNEWTIHLSSIEWKYYVLIWIEQLERSQLFTLEDLVDGVEKFLKNEHYFFEHIPLIENRHHLLPVRLFLFILEKKGIIRAISSTEWMYVKPAKRFHQEEMKLKELKKLIR